MIKKFFSIIIAAAAAISAAGAPQYHFSYFRSEEGLPINTVTCSTTDHFGYLWFGTRDGICRFDGSEFDVIEEPDINNSINGLTFALCEDTDGLLWYCTAKGTGHYNLYTDEITEVKELSGLRIYDICTDANGDVWFSADGSAIILEKHTGEYRRLTQAETGTVLHHSKDMNGDIWITSSEGFLTRYNAASRTTEKKNISLKGSSTGEYPVLVTPIDDRFLLLSTSENDIYKFNTRTSETTFLTHTGHTINCLLARRPTEFWAGTFNGLFIFDSQKNEATLIDNTWTDGLTNNNITCILKDHMGNVWMGSYYGGVNLWSDLRHSIATIFQTDRNGSFYGYQTHAFAPYRDGRIFVGTEDGYLNLLDFDERRSVCLSDAPGFPKELNFHGLVTENDTLWIASYNRGIFRYDIRTGKTERHPHSPSDQCVCMLKTSDGIILVGTTSGMFRLNRENDRFESVESLDSKLFIHTIFQDSRGTIWVGTFGGGLFYSTDMMKTFEKISTEYQENAPKLRYITHLSEDRDHNLRIATDGEGICRMSLNRRPEFIEISRNDGLPSNIATASVQDLSGAIWISTTKGMVKMDPVTLDISKVFRESHNPVGDQFLNGACYRFADGRLCFGTTRGMITFNPGITQDPIVSSPLYFRSITTESGLKKTAVTQTGKSVTMTENIELREKDAAHLSISFSTPYFSNFSSPKYEYSLSRENKVFTHDITENSTISITNLPSGKYRLSVRLTDSTIADAEKTLQIKIIPPLYKSTAARLFYILFLLAVAAVLVGLLLKQRTSDEKREIEQLERIKQKEIYDAKINFFTNITHEIRTPLSLIKMPVEKIISEQDYSESSKEDIFTIKSNTDRLLELTNQLLDMRKMEQNQVTVQFLKEDICTVIRKTSDYFAKAAKEQHISYTVSLPHEPVIMMCSADFIKKIVSNLLSNAVKYCTSSIELSLTVSPGNDLVYVRVTSDGDLITGEEREKIFTPFYQIKTVGTQLKGSNGTGLGLPYARTLATLHKGSLILDPSVTDRNSFLLTLPCTQTQDLEETEEAPAAVQNERDDNVKRTILIVEDAEQMRKYLAKELSELYYIHTASNGEAAVEIIKNKKIDLVISDIMMPIMDGCQLCNYIKTNVEYSHIPIILLTAVVGVETRIETLESGADGYIEKPFEMALLKANISNLFRNREISYKQFSNSPLSHFHSTSLNKVENAFMEKLHSTVMKHMADQNLGIDILTDLLGTSKTTLYRKIKANTGLNTNEYIRLCRLKKAADMLSSQEYRINEVAYLTGFSSPSYFATSFQKQFNISPSAFVKNIKG